MNEEKNLNEELEAVENSAESIEEAPEVAEVIAEAVEEASEATETEGTNEAENSADEEPVSDDVVAEAVKNVNAEVSAETVVAETKKFPVVPVVVGAVAAVLVIVLVVLGIKFGPSLFNKYNKAGYVDVSGRTIAEVAESSGMELADFLEEYGLPADMPANTSESAAYYAIPCSKMAEMYGMDFATLKSTLQFPDTITEETTWGEAEGEVRLSVYVGEDRLEEFKQSYNLGDEVTGDTQWKEIRNTVDEFNRQQRIESEKAAKEEENSSDEAATAPENVSEEAETPETTAAAE
ncbi:MAG: hypothetical protein ACI4C7_10345 [Clostridia bacterium]